MGTFLHLPDCLNLIYVVLAIVLVTSQKLQCKYSAMLRA
jgi:hypothetical protein